MEVIEMKRVLSTVIVVLLLLGTPDVHASTQYIVSGNSMGFRDIYVDSGNVYLTNGNIAVLSREHRDIFKNIIALGITGGEPIIFPYGGDVFFLTPNSAIQYEILELVGRDLVSLGALDMVEKQGIYPEYSTIFSSEYGLAYISFTARDGIFRFNFNTKELQALGSPINSTYVKHAVIVNETSIAIIFAGGGIGYVDMDTGVTQFVNYTGLDTGRLVYKDYYMGTFLALTLQGDTVYINRLQVDKGQWETVGELDTSLGGRCSINELQIEFSRGEQFTTAATFCRDMEGNSHATLWDVSRLSGEVSSVREIQYEGIVATVSHFGKLSFTFHAVHEYLFNPYNYTVIPLDGREGVDLTVYYIVGGSAVVLAVLVFWLVRTGRLPVHRKSRNK